MEGSYFLYRINARHLPDYPTQMYNVLILKKNKEWMTSMLLAMQFKRRQFFLEHSNWCTVVN